VTAHRACAAHLLPVTDTVTSTGAEAIVCASGCLERKWLIVDEKGNIIGAANASGGGLLLNGYNEPRVSLSSAVTEPPIQRRCAKGHTSGWVHISGQDRCRECRRASKDRYRLRHQVARLRAKLAELEAI